MEIQEEKRLRAMVSNLKRQKKRYLEVRSHIPKLIHMVAPATVCLVDEIQDARYPSLSRFAIEHGTCSATLLGRLKRFGIISKRCGTWVLAPEYRDQGLVLYTIGRLQIYSKLDMLLLPEGEKFMERFLPVHTVRRKKAEDVYL